RQAAGSPTRQWWWTCAARPALHRQPGKGADSGGRCGMPCAGTGAPREARIPAGTPARRPHSLRRGRCARHGPCGRGTSRLRTWLGFLHCGIGGPALAQAALVLPDGGHGFLVAQVQRRHVDGTIGAGEIGGVHRVELRAEVGQGGGEGHASPPVALAIAADISACTASYFSTDSGDRNPPPSGSTVSHSAPNRALNFWHTSSSSGAAEIRRALATACSNFGLSP